MWHAFKETVYDIRLLMQTMYTAYYITVLKAPCEDSCSTSKTAWLLLSIVVHLRLQCHTQNNNQLHVQTAAVLMLHVSPKEFLVNCHLHNASVLQRHVHQLVFVTFLYEQTYNDLHFSR